MAENAPRTVHLTITEGTVSLIFEILKNERGVEPSVADVSTAINTALGTLSA